MRKSVISLALLICQFGYPLDAKSKQEHNGKVVKVIIGTVEMLSQTENKIDCNEFYESFGSNIRNFVFNNPKDIDRILRLSKGAVVDSLSAYRIDVRAKMVIIYSNGKNDSLCFDGLGHVSNDSKVIKLHSHDLLLFIDSLYHAPVVSR